MHNPVNSAHAASEHFQLGNTFKQLGRLSEAEASYRRALEISPDWAEAFDHFLVTLNSHPDKSAQEVFAVYCEYEARFGLPVVQRGYVTFGTMTRAVRINRRTIRVWAAILKPVAGARLVLDIESFQDDAMASELAHGFAAQGIGPEGLQIGYRSPPWEALCGIDIGLDCFPQNSGTTLFETLYMGVPYVTLADRPSVGRLGSSILRGVAHPEWIAKTEDEYVEIAVAMASDLPKLANLRSGLRPQMEAGP